MRVLISVLVLAIAMSVPLTVIAEEGEATSCGKYLAMDDVSKRNYAGAFLWVALLQLKEKLRDDQAGALIGMVDEIRKMLDVECKRLEPSAPVITAASKILELTFSIFFLVEED